MAPQRPRIAIVPMPDEPGHLLPMLTLGKRLKDRGCDVVFLGIADDRTGPEAAGFRYIEGAERAFPAGSIAALKESWTTPWRIAASGPAWMRRLRHACDEMREALVPRLREESIDLFIADALMPHGALLGLALGRRALLLHPNLWQWNRALPPLSTPHLPREDGTLPARARLRWFLAERRLLPPQLAAHGVARLFGVDERDVIALLAPGLSLRSFRELQRLVPNVVACPVAFDFPCRRPDNFHYIDALVDAERDRGAPFDWSRVARGSRVIYLSIGTQGWVMREATRFLRVVIQAVARRPDWHLVLSAGRFVAAEALGPLPHNVEVHARVPQIQVLGRASLMITHAGLNSIKECILAGVPMLAFPAGRDQPGNAARVHYHGLGRRADYRRIDADEAFALMNEVMEDPAYRTRVAAMREQFLAAEREDAAWRVIEGELAASG